MEANTKKETQKKKDNTRLIIFTAVIIALIIIYFWRKDVEYRKCYEIANKNNWGGVIKDYNGNNSERCKVILNK